MFKNNGYIYHSFHDSAIAVLMYCVESNERDVILLSNTMSTSFYTTLNQGPKRIVI